MPLLAIMLHAYSLGSGTYTGLEAVSNNVNRLVNRVYEQESGPCSTWPYP